MANGKRTGLRSLFTDSRTSSRNYTEYNVEKNFFKDVESLGNALALELRAVTYVPQIDYSDVKNFVRFGSAELFYEGALNKIIDYYPYDGSEAEKNEFYNKLFEGEKYIFDNLYPRFTGYGIFSADGWGSLNGSLDNGYGLPQSLEHITFKGGPHSTSNTAALSTLTNNPFNNKYQSANLHEENPYLNAGLPSDYDNGTRLSNLKSNFDTGVTVEFWLKHDGFDTDLTEKQVVFDLWNSSSIGSTDYGRLRIELFDTTGVNNTAFRITAQSSSATLATPSVEGVNPLTSSIGTQTTKAFLTDWHHYAFSFHNSGSNLIAKLYVDGKIDDTNIYENKKLGEITTSKMIGRIGALVTEVSASTPFSDSGAGKLSGSVDEFRFWKDSRDAREISLNYASHIGGGTNTDISNTSLGVYYKFNEGITGTNTIDSTVLDYSGRLTNGVWTGFSSNSRNTGSAFISSSAVESEYREPVIYSTHPDYERLRTTLLNSGSAYDGNNNGAFLNYAPSWIVDEHDDVGNKNLQIISHIVGSYFDKMYFLSNEIPKFKHATYTTSSARPISFASHLPTSLGLYVPDLFIDETILERLYNKNEEFAFEGSLQDTKNLIYHNLYNNLTAIFKSKGTEKSIKNVMRCFYLDDELVKLKKYNVNATYEMSNNLSQVVVDKKGINFNNINNLNGVIYQRKNDDNTETSGFISGSLPSSISPEKQLGFTLETDVIFPNYFTRYSSINRSGTEISLFGVHAVHTASVPSQDGTDTTFLSKSVNYKPLTMAGGDIANFQVSAVRAKANSKNVYFQLTSSYEPHPIPTLTSSVFLNVYDNTKWNISVRVEPNWQDSRHAKAADSLEYKVIFRGVNDVLGTTKNSFEVTGTFSTISGSNFLRSPKRVYVGAKRTNLTGALLVGTDVEMLNCRAWAKSINNDSLGSHNLGSENSGVEDLQQYLIANQTESTNVDITNFQSLVLDWTFNNVTSSDGSGNFFVQDASSGSALIRDNYGWIGNVAGHQHSGYAENFATSSTDVIKQIKINSFKAIEPEQVVSGDMINILSSDDQVIGIDQTVPSYFFNVEKSMYDAISSEMLTFFAGVVDFNNLIGEPVHRYRARYKDMEKLRATFYQKVNKTTDVEKYFDYYKWFDDALSSIIAQLLPASADGLEKINNVVESHILERNKYKTPFPTLETKDPGPDAPMYGITEKAYPYAVGFSSLPQSPRSTNIRETYWRERAERSAIEITSGDSTIDAHREIYRNVIISNPFLRRVTPTLFTGEATYEPDLYAARTFIKTQLYKVRRLNNIKGGSNFTGNKNIHFALNALRPAGDVNTANGGYVPLNVLVAFMTDLEKVKTNNDPKPGLNKIERHLKVFSGKSYDEGSSESILDSATAFPFSIYETTVKSGHQAELINRLTGANIQITNLHNDVYGPDLEKPMQGIFTEHNVGGHQSRHIDLNTGNDNQISRPEAWRILLGTCTDTILSGAIGVVGPDYPNPNTHLRGPAAYPYELHQKAVYYRDMTAKRPVNIKNIRITGSKVLGNYSNTYEYVQAVGAFDNPRHFIDNQPNLPAEAFQLNSTSSTSIRTFLDIKRTSGNHFQNVSDYSTAYLTSSKNKSIIISRFSNPGGIEVMSKGYQDFRSSEFSVYNSLNYRNLTVRKPWQSPAGSVPEAVVEGDTTDIKVSDMHGKDFGLSSHLARHTAKFGRDSFIFPDDSDRKQYDLNNNFVGYSDYQIYRSSESLQGWWRLNENVASSGDVVDSSGNGRTGTFDSSGDRPAFSTTSFPSRFIQTGSCTFANSDSDATKIGLAATWDAIIGNDTGNGSTEKMTFAAWIFKTGNGGFGVGRIIDFGDDEITMFTDSQDQLRFAVLWSTDRIFFESDASFNTNEWVHVAITYDATGNTNFPKMYINGVESSVTRTSGDQGGTFEGISTEACYIGNRATADAGFDGNLADVAVWNSVLTTEEIGAIYNASKIPEQHGPGASYDQLPGFHKIHRNNLTRNKINYAYESRDIPGSGQVRLVNEKSLYFQSDDAHGNTDDNILYLGHSTSDVSARSQIQFDAEWAEAYGGADKAVTYTWSGWMKFPDTTDNPRGDNGQQGIFDIGYNNDTDRAIMRLSINASGRRALFVLGNTDGDGANQTKSFLQGSNVLPVIQDNEWHHFAFTFSGSHGNLKTDGTFIKLWVDGTETNLSNGLKTDHEFFPTSSHKSNFRNFGINLEKPVSFFGHLNTGGGTTPYEFSGFADEVSMYRKILSSDEIGQLYNAGHPLNLTHSSAPATGSLLLWFRMGDDEQDNTSLSGSRPQLNDSTAQLTNVAPALSSAPGNSKIDFAYLTCTDAADHTLSVGTSSINFLTGNTPPQYLYEYISGFTDDNVYDNFYVQHQIPRSSKQYAWITASLVSDNNFVGYTPKDFLVKQSAIGLSGTQYVDAYNFVSQSEFGSYIASTGQRVWGKDISAPVTFEGPRSRIFQTTHLNLNINEPISQSSNTLGFPPSVPLLNINDVTPGNQYRNTALVTHADASGPFGYQSNDYGSGYVFNSLMFKRGNQYGFNDFTALRQSDNAIFRAQRRNNTITLIDKQGDDGALTTYSLQPVSNRTIPYIINFESDQGFTYAVKATHENSKIYFNDIRMDNVYAPISDTINSPAQHIIQIARSRNHRLNWIISQQQLFPSLRNEFKSSSYTKPGFDNKYWRDDRQERVTANALGYFYSSAPLPGFPTASAEFLFPECSDRLECILAPAGFGFKNPGYPTDASPESAGMWVSVDAMGNYASASSWPLDAPENFTTREAISPIWPQTQRGAPGQLQNDYSFFLPITSSLVGEIITLFFSYYRKGTGIRYARPHVCEIPTSMVSPNDARSHYPFQSSSNILPIEMSGAFNQEHTIFFRGLGGGAANWDTPANAGIYKPTFDLITSQSSIEFTLKPSQPWFNNYSDFNHDLKLVAKGFSVIPEYRISENVSKYIRDAELDNPFEELELEIPHVTASTTINDESFFITYSNSEFLKDFLQIKRESLLDAKEIRLSCTGAIRFNPYKGFYPVQRSINLIEQFKNSYQQNFGAQFNYFGPVVPIRPADDLATSILDGDPSNGGGFDPGTGSVKNGAYRPLLASLFSPGILYNSIKSGMAVDYPIVTNPGKIAYYAYNTGSIGIEGERFTRSGSLANCSYATSFDVSGAVGGKTTNTGSFFDERLPFETMLEPTRHLAGKSFFELESQPLMRLSIFKTASYVANVEDDVYPQMARNFFGAVPSFFLKNSQFTSLKSNIKTDTYSFSGSEVYMMRVKMNRSTEGLRTYTYEVDGFGKSEDTTAGGDISVWAPDGCKTYDTDLEEYLPIESGSYFTVPQDPRYANFYESSGSAVPGLFRQTFTMYSRPSAFGPDLAGRPGPGHNFTSGSQLSSSAAYTGSLDCFSGYAPAYTPPYYDGESWADLIFRPVGDREYKIEDIIANTEAVYWRFDAGRPQRDHGAHQAEDTRALIYERLNPHLGAHAPYSGQSINQASMQISASVNLFGVEKVPFTEIDQFGNLSSERPGQSVGQRWVIRPKFETPMLNFIDITGSQITYPNPGAMGGEQVAKGMWHQFGRIPTGSEGVFLSIEDIPKNWLRNHYDVIEYPSAYNSNGADLTSNTAKSLHENVRSLADLVGFNKNQLAKLGQLKEKTTLKEAIVAIPYIIENTTESGQAPGVVASQNKKFINIPKERYDAASAQNYNSAEGDSLLGAGVSISKQLQKMQRYILPPQFDFINNPGSALQPFVMYIFEFEYNLDRDDLSYIWQNIAPRDYKKMSFQMQSVAHELVDTEVLNESILEENQHLRWMLFKVKQKGQEDYWDYVDEQAKSSTVTPKYQDSTKLPQKFDNVDDPQEPAYTLRHNWPYDYVSFVEMVKMNAEIKYAKTYISIHDRGLPESLIQNVQGAAANSLVSGVSVGSMPNLNDFKAGSVADEASAPQYSVLPPSAPASVLATPGPGAGILSPITYDLGGTEPATVDASPIPKTVAIPDQRPSSNNPDDVIVGATLMSGEIAEQVSGGTQLPTDDRPVESDGSPSLPSPPASINDDDDDDDDGGGSGGGSGGSSGGSGGGRTRRVRGIPIGGGGFPGSTRRGGY